VVSARIQERGARWALKRPVWLRVEPTVRMKRWRPAFARPRTKLAWSIDIVVKGVAIKLYLRLRLVTICLLKRIKELELISSSLLDRLMLLRLSMWSPPRLPLLLLILLTLVD